MRDESLSGGKYHGPSAAPGLTSREYYELKAEYEYERERERDWADDGPDFDDAEDDDE